jgi:hypothetical protein
MSRIEIPWKVPARIRWLARPATTGAVPTGRESRAVAAQIQHFPQVVDQINADPDVALVDHLGDIKSGSSLCTTSTSP